MVRNPACFLLDEPLSNLDAQLRLEMRAELKRLHRRLRTTMLHVTHDQQEAMSLGDRVAVMNDGSIKQCGTPSNVYLHPADRFVAGFFGAPAMNFLEGMMVADQGLWFQGAGIRIRLNDRLAAALQARDRQPVVLGIRPESLQIVVPDSRPMETDTIQLTVDVIELLGDTMDVVCSTPSGRQVNARLKAQPLNEGRVVSMRIDRDRIHLFEPGVRGRNLMPMDMEP